MLSNGKATVTYANGGEALEIKASAGATISLNAGPAASNALSRLGITAGVITAPAKKGSTTASSTTANSATAAKTVYGLGLNTLIDLNNSGDAGVAQISMQSVMSAIQNIYQKANAPPAAASTLPTSSTANTPAPAYLKAQISNYSLALQTFSAASSLSSTSSSSSSSNSFGLPSSLLLA